MTVQVNDAEADAPVASCAVTVTVDVPAVDGLPVMVPLLPEIDVPAGSPDAVNVSDWPPAESAAGTGTDTAVPVMPSHITEDVAPCWVEPANAGR